MRPLALTLGEPAGIGPDIALMAWRRRKDLALPPFYMIADMRHLSMRAQSLGLDVPLAECTPERATETFGTALPVVPLGRPVTAAPGDPDATSGPAAIASIECATRDVLDGKAAAIVTNPVSKDVLYAAGFAAPGHTEFLAQLAERATGKAAMPVMMLWSDELAVVPVTIHIALKDVAARLTSDLIVATGRIVARELAERFGVANPRLAVAGLNPHAGENGALGEEDRDVVAPAVAELAKDGIAVRGPLPADTLFDARARTTYDAALCMYHDQALIPIKTIAFDRAVNVTLGLPFVRTSPDHGTAFDIAGTGKADPSSLIAALNLAARLARTPSLAAAR